MRSVGIEAAIQRPLKESVLFDAIVGAVRGAVERGAPVAEAPRPMREDIHILVVEDNPVNQRVALRQLARLGFRADAVGNGIEAIEALDGIQYDLVLMDCQMPELDGFEATREIRIREKPRGRHTPIIALTANALGGVREQCIAAGMDDYLSKPVRESDLERVVNRWLPSVVRDPLDAGVLDRLRSLSPGSESAFMREVALLYLDDAPVRITAIREALSGGQADEAAAAAHALKSSSGSIGATLMSNLAKELEAAAMGGDLEGAARAFEKLCDEYPKVEHRLHQIAG